MFKRILKNNYQLPFARINKDYKEFDAMTYQVNSLKYYGVFEEKNEYDLLKEKEFLQFFFTLLLEEFGKKPNTRSIDLTYNIAREPNQIATLNHYAEGVLISIPCKELNEKINFQELWYILNGESGHYVEFLDEERRFKIFRKGTDNQFSLYISDTQFLNANSLSEIKTFNDEFLSFIQEAIKNKKNFLIGGGTGSGKTSLLNILMETSSNQLYAVIESNQNPELKFSNNTSIRANTDNFFDPKVYNSFLGLPADYYIFDDIRQGFSFSHLQPFVGTIHANNPKAALHRLQNLHLQSGNFLDSSQMAIESKYIDFIVQISYLKNGTRRITSVSEILGMDDYGALINNDRVCSYNLNKDYLITDKESDKREIYSQEIFSYDANTDSLNRTDWVHGLF